MELNDCLGDISCIENFIPSPKILQSKHRYLSSRIESGVKRASSPSERIAWLSLTRFGLQNNKIVALEALVSELKQFDSIHFTLHKKNKYLGQYISKRLPHSRVEYSSRNYKYWKNGLSIDIHSSITASIMFFILTYLWLILSVVLGFFWPKKKIDIEWMNFANNKSTVDLPLIDQLSNQGTKVGVPAFLPTFRKNNFYFFSSRRFNFSDLTIIMYELSFNSFKFFEKVLANVNSELSTNYPLEFPVSLRSQFLLLHQYLYSNYTNNVEAICLFRGGNASGIWHEALFSERKTILMTHGTEFNIIDHDIYKYLDLNILPSEIIVRNWLEEDKGLDANRLTGLGRPYYEALRNRVKLRNLEKGPIGLVLTYSSDARTESFISDINFLAAKYNKSILIKPRPNFTNDLSYVTDMQNAEVWDGDIYSFLGEVSLVVAGVSDYGVLGMTVTDAISLGIPSLYYTQGVDPQECGYSYSSVMSGFIYEELKSLKLLSDSHSQYSTLLEAVRDANIPTREQLGPNKGVFDSICRLLENESRQ